MVQNLLSNKIMWLITASLTLLASVLGIAFPNIYSKVVGSELIPAVLATDIFTIISASLVLVLAISLKKGQPKKEIVILGILGFFFYNYGIFVIERMYNQLYLVYMAIFTFSFWSLLYAVFDINKSLLSKVTIPRITATFSLVLSLIQPLMFYPLWTIQLLPLITEGKKIENLYSIYILDMCLIMPAFLIISILLFKKKGAGILLAPIIFILGFFEIFSLAISELAKPFFNMPVNISGFWQSLILSLVFLVTALIHLKKTKILPAV